MHRAGFAVLPFLALAAACAIKAVETPPAAAEAPGVLVEPADAPTQSLTYTCENGLKLEVTFEESGNARVKAGAMAEIELTGMPAASGNYFSNGRYSLHTKGMDEALWTVGRMLPLHCTAPEG